MYERFLGWLSGLFFGLSDWANERACALARRAITEEAMREEDRLFNEMMQGIYPEWRDRV